MNRKILSGSISVLLLLTAVGAMAENVEDTSFSPFLSEPLPEEPPDNWGIVLYSDATTYSIIRVLDGGSIWWIDPVMEYKVLAIGRHSIHWVIEYDVYTRTPDGLEQQTGSIDGNDSIYLFDMQKQPMFRLYASATIDKIAFLFLDHGEWWCKLYVDGELKSEVYGSVVYQ